MIRRLNPTIGTSPPRGKKKQENGTEKENDEQGRDPLEPNDPGFPEGVREIAGTVEESIDHDLF